ncbi:MAG: hypothetical protein AB8G22_16440 [Saprospiraceae bacterium]
MPKQKTDDLIQLIKSLTRAEKRHFRLFVRRNQASNDILFLQLFDFLDKHKEYDEQLILKKLPGIKKRQLSNLKAHLYKQLLMSLRLLNRNNHQDMQLREQVDYALVLYDKGLYRQSLDVLGKAKKRALELQRHRQAMEIIAAEKQIEGQYITRSIQNRAEELTQQANEVAQYVMANNQLTNLALQMYGLYLKVGYVKDEKDYYLVREFFNANFPKINVNELDFFGKISYHRSHVWYYQITQNFPQSYRHAQTWIDTFHEIPALIGENMSLYLKGLHSLMNANFNTWQYAKLNGNLEILEAIPDKHDITQSTNVEGLFYLYKYIHNIKKHFMEGTFTEGVKLVPELMKIIKEDRYNWDDHRVMVFYYRIACLYFSSGDNDKAIDYLNMILNQKNPDYRTDIQAFARILSLISHYEMGNMQLVEYQVKSVYRFLAKMEDLGMVQKEIFRFVRKIPRIRQGDTKKEFINLKNKLEKVRHHPYEKRPFLYLDIISWLESKIEERNVEDVIREKFLEGKAPWE